MTTKANVRRALRNARKRVARGWCQGSYATDANFISVAPWSRRAVCWCLVGSYYGRPWAEPVRRAISEALDNGYLANWNDARDRLKGEVLDLIDRAIANAQ
jgi:hypothetical protein